MENMDKELTVSKWVLINWLENTPKFMCPNCLPMPKSLGFQWKKASLCVRSLLKANPPKFRFMESLHHTAILKYFEFLRQFNKKQNMIKKNYQLNRNEKFVDKAQQCFAFLLIKPKFKFTVQWSWFLET